MRRNMLFISFPLVFEIFTANAQASALPLGAVRDENCERETDVRPIDVVQFNSKSYVIRTGFAFTRYFDIPVLQLAGKS